jgi:hypothetical protein
LLLVDLVGRTSDVGMTTTDTTGAVSDAQNCVMETIRGEHLLTTSAVKGGGDQALEATVFAP